MYSINNIPLSNFGIFPTKSRNSNIALSGFLDMPQRLGKTHHSWGDEDGLEPYVSATDLKYGGRDLTYSGYIDGTTKSYCFSLAQELNVLFSSFTEVVPFATPWGTFNVFVKDTISIDYIGDGYAKVTIPLRQPSVTITQTKPTGNSSAIYAIDGVLLDDLGAFVTKTDNNFNRPKPKEQKHTAFGVEGYQITKPGKMVFNTEIIFSADSFTALFSNVEKLHALLATSGLRNVNVDGIARECFNISGFTVDRIKILDELSVCRVKLPMVMATSIVEVEDSFLLHNGSDYILTNNNERIRI